VNAMNDIVSMIVENLKATDWSGPAIFVVIILAILLVLRKWSMFLLILLTVVLGWGAQDLIITNLESSREVISLPFVIYCVGGGTIIILALVSFFKSSI
jgi:hypothetical protein